MKQDDFILKAYPFLLFFFSYMIFGLGMLAYFGKDDLHILFNQYNHPFLDVFFKYYTDIATTGALILVLFYVIFTKTWRDFALLLSSFLSLTIVSTFIKRVFYIHVHRPTYYFEQKGIDLHLVEGVFSQIPYTFPSGHTMNGFLCFLFIGLYLKNKWLQIPLVILASLVAVSRVYLSKHFVLDVLGGSFMGVFGLMFFFYIIRSWDKPKLDQKILKKTLIP